MKARWLLVTQLWPVGTQTSYLPMPHARALRPQQKQPAPMGTGAACLNLRAQT